METGCLLTVSQFAVSFETCLNRPGYKILYAVAIFLLKK